MPFWCQMEKFSGNLFLKIWGSHLSIFAANHLVWCLVYINQQQKQLWEYIYHNTSSENLLMWRKSPSLKIYTPKAVFVAGLYILSITPNFSRASYSRCSYFFLNDSSQCLLILWKQLSPSTIYVKFWKYRVDLLMKLWFLKSFIEIVQKDMFGRNLPKPNNFIINTKRQNSINCQ
jgi:hypothetical protein